VSTVDAKGTGRETRPLTPRQRQVLDLVVMGRGNKAIASELGIGEQAAKEHVSTLLRRFGATSRAALAEIGTQLQILGTTDVDVRWLPYLFAAAPIGIQVLRGPDHIVVAVNATNRRALDREIVGLPFREAFPRAAGGMIELLDSVYATGEPIRRYEYEGTWLRDGELQRGYGDFVAQPTKASDGTVTGVMIFGSDVTDRVLARRHAERITAEQLAIFDLMQEGVIVADSSGRLLKINEAARRLAGIPPEMPRSMEPIEMFQIRGADGRQLPLEEIPLMRAIAGETVPWTDYVSFNPERREDVRLRVAGTPVRDASGTVIGGVIVMRRLRGE
jgi:PAS domain-containing protein